VMRAVHACPRAPSVRPWRWIVSIGAQAQGAVWNPARRTVSRHPEAAACSNTRHWWAATR